MDGWCDAPSKRQGRKLVVVAIPGVGRYLLTPAKNLELTAAVKGPLTVFSLDDLLCLHQTGRFGLTGEGDGECATVFYYIPMQDDNLFLLQMVI